MQCVFKASSCSRLLLVQKFSTKHARILAVAEKRTASLEKLFPKREEFQSRHIGPRDHEQLQMLQTIGFKVETIRIHNNIKLEIYKYIEELSSH